MKALQLLRGFVVSNFRNGSRWNGDLEVRSSVGCLAGSWGSGLLLSQDRQTSRKGTIA